MLLSNFISDLLRRARGGIQATAAMEADRLWRQALDLRAAGDAAGAGAAGEAMLARFPGDARGHYLLGIAQGEAGDPGRSLQHLDRAVALAPGWAEAHAARGAALLLLKRPLEAEASCRRALELDGEVPGAHFNLALLLLRSGNGDEAVRCLERAHEQQPASGAVAWELVRMLVDRGEPERARVVGQRTVESGGDDAPARKALGLAFLHLHDPQRALEQFQLATARASRDNESWLHAGMALQELGRLDEALAAYERALELKPGHSPVRWRRALVRLTKGEFERGWGDYEARLASDSHPWRRFPQPLWQGESLAGKTLLVHAEQGLGDEIMFASCLPELIAQAGHCVIDCHPRLEALFRRSFPTATVHGGLQTDDLSWLAQCPPADYQVPAGSAPRILRNRTEDFPRHAGYLCAGASRTAAWKARLATIGTGLNVGLSWRGGTQVSRSHVRSLSLVELLPMLRVGGVNFVDLQYGDTAPERARLEDEHGVTLAHWREALDDYDETAALVSALDLTLSVCTAVVHLAGALGRPAWVMTPYSPEWRYGCAGEAMVWYPSVRLVRQASYGEWEPVIAALARELALASRGNRSDAMTEDTPTARLFRDAMAMQSQGKRAEAIALYRRLLSGQNDHPDALNNLGILLHDRGDAGEARKLFEEALRIAPGMVAARFNLARSLIDLDDFGTAAQILEVLTDDAPDDAEICLTLGVAFDRLGRLDEAEEWYHEAAFLSPQCERARMTRFGRAFFLDLDAAPPPGPGAPEDVWVAGPVESVQRVVVAAGDSAYLRRFTAAFMHSLSAHRPPGTLLHLHAIDPDAGLEESLLGLATRIGACPVRLTRERMPRLRAAAKVYYACARYLHLPRWLADYGVPILVSDIDVVFEDDPAAIFQAVEGAELGIFHRPTEQRPWLEICACAVLAVPSVATLRYAETVSAYMRRLLMEEGTGVGLDQVAPHCTLRALAVSGSAPASVSIREVCEAAMWFIGGRRTDQLQDPRFLRYNLPL